MSRIGKMPVPIPAGVEVEAERGHVRVKGPKGELEQRIHPDLEVEIEAGILTVKRPDDTKEHKAQHGLARKLISNMVTGVTDGFKKELTIVGVGYRVAKQEGKLVFTLGFSHPVERVDPEGIKTTVEGTNRIIVEGIDRQKVGQYAANIRAIRPPEPYKGKGVRYSDENVKLKVGKAG
jgi:large subunit ribosomal protein L6